MNAIEQILVSQLRASRKKQEKECRICLEEDEETSKLIIPCKCTGSIEYTHEHCLIEWIKRRVEMDRKRKASCEVCHTEFRYRLANQRHFDCGELGRHYRRDRKSLLSFLVFYLVFLLVLLAMVGMVVVSKEDETFFLASFAAQS